jgi:hypothetical protein
MYTKIAIVAARIALWLSDSPATVLKGNASVYPFIHAIKFSSILPCKVDIHRLSLKKKDVDKK